MAAPLTFEQIQKQAADLNYSVRYNTKTGELQFRAPAKRNPAFEKLLVANKPVIQAHYTTPEVVKGRVKAATDENFIGRINDFVNRMRDKYVMPGAEAAGGFVGRHSWLADLPGVDTPEKASQLGSGIAREGVKTVLPDTATGKGINAALMAVGQPEEAPEAEAAIKEAPTLLRTLGNATREALSSRRGRILTPGLVGGATGYASGEGGPAGIAQGVAAGAAGEIPAVKGQLHEDRVGRAERTRRLYDDIVPGQRISKILNLSSYDNLLNRYGNWVRALKDGRVQREAGDRFAEGMDNIHDSVRAITLNKAAEIKKAFQERMRLPFNTRKSKAQAMGVVGEWKEALQKYEQTLKEGRDLLRGMKLIKRLRRSVFDNKGAPRLSAMTTPKTEFGGKTPREMLEVLQQDVRQGLQRLHPALKGTYDAVTDEYRMFAALRDVADTPGSIDVPSGHVNLDNINQAMDEAPRKLQSRLGDDLWDNLRQSLRRGAPDKPDYNASQAYFDQPGEIGRLRAIMYGAKGHLATSVEPLANIAAGGPITAKPVGNLVPRKQIAPGRIPRLITGAPVNEAVDYTRENE